MRLSIDAQADSLSARNRVEEARKRAELAKQAKAVEIIGDSGDCHETMARAKSFRIFLIVTLASSTPLQQRTSALKLENFLAIGTLRVEPQTIPPL